MSEMPDTAARKLHHIARVTACPCCDGALSDPFYHVGPVPVHSCLMLDAAADALAFPEGDVNLSFCKSCGFVTNIDFDPKWSAYAPNYEDQQSFSPTFNSFAGQLAANFVQRHELHGKSVVEIGCSKGDFLRLLAELGNMTGVGIDPSVVKGRVPEPRSGSLKFLPDYYGSQHSDISADAIVCRHTLEHIQDVSGLLALMRAHAERNPGCVVMIEVPDATRLWVDGAFEDIYYEHCSYFTPGSLARALRRAGFAVTDLRREYGDQYLVVEATLDQNANRFFDIEETVSDLEQTISGFAEGIPGKLDAWRDFLGDTGTNGKVAVWGSGSKCVSFLRTLNAVEKINMIIDINPHRSGRFAPGVPVSISMPDDCRQVEPGLMIVMNAVYENEIRSDLARMGLSPRIESLGRIPQ